jgi:hypothetical protein
MFEAPPARPDSLQASPARAGAPPTTPLEATPPARPTLRSRMARYALMAGPLCALLGVLEGGVVGAILAPRKDPVPMILAISLDRGVLLGLLGVTFGALIGVLDYYLSSAKKRR